MFSKIFYSLVLHVSACGKPKPITTNCYATETYKAQPGMDTWCNINCPVGNCPTTHCICEDVATTATTTASSGTSTTNAATTATTNAATTATTTASSETE